MHHSYYVFFFFFISFSVRFAEDQFVGIFWLNIFFWDLQKARKAIRCHGTDGYSGADAGDIDHIRQGFGTLLLIDEDSRNIHHVRMYIFHREAWVILPCLKVFMFYFLSGQGVKHPKWCDFLSTDFALGSCFRLWSAAVPPRWTETYQFPEKKMTQTQRWCALESG